MEDNENLVKCFPEAVTYLPGVAGTSAQFYGSRPAAPQHYFSHHHHYHYQPSTATHHPTTQPATIEDHQHFLHNPANSTTSTATPQQHSSSSLTQHQAHHNFWSDISGGGSSIPSSLLATSSSSLSSSTGLPMSSNNNFDGIDTPLTVANSLLDMRYSAAELSVPIHKLRPRPESCVNTRSDVLLRPEQLNRPKSSCGSLTISNSNHSSPDRTLLAPPDLDETISANNLMDTQEERFADLGSYGNNEDSCRMQSPSRLVNQTRMPHYMHHRHQHHHIHFHQAALDSIISQSLSSQTNGPMPAISSTINNVSANVGDLTNGVRNNVSSSAVANNFGSTICGTFGTPPPPLPPKPKLGVPPRGPPPRPPSRQLPLALPTASVNFGSVLPPSEGLTSDEAEETRVENPAQTNSKDQDPISFV